jgi:hypothetical protein
MLCSLLTILVLIHITTRSVSGNAKQDLQAIVEDLFPKSDTKNNNNNNNNEQTAIEDQESTEPNSNNCMSLNNCI